MRSFLKYQQERFPLAVLIPISLSGVMGAAAILGVHDWISIVGGTCITVAFLFHIRVTDEIRDFSHDSEFHAERPIQRNVISVRELKDLRMICLILFFGLSIGFSFMTFILALVLFSYSALAGRDFFRSQRLRKHFYLYNLLNMVQLIGLQVVVYSAFGWTYAFSPIIVANMVMIFVLSALLEIARKIKAEDKENAGKDTYSFHLGQGGSLILFAVTLVLVLVPFGYTLSLIGKTGGLLIPTIVCAIGLSVALLYWKKRTRQLQDLLVLVSMIYYLTVNIALYTLMR